MFVCDDRILPMLTGVLGKTFLSAKKQPVPIKIFSKGCLLSLGAQIARARDSAFLVRSYGDCWCVKLAHTGMTEAEVSANLMAGIEAVVDKIPNKWKNIKAINIKSTDSVALPVYSNLGDLPPAPAAPQVKVVTDSATAAAGKGEGVEKGDASAKPEADGGQCNKKRKKQPRPLIRQQLKQIKQDLKDEKEYAGKVGASVGSPPTPAKDAAKQDSRKSKRNSQKSKQDSRKRYREAADLEKAAPDVETAADALVATGPSAAEGRVAAGTPKAQKATGGTGEKKKKSPVSSTKAGEKKSGVRGGAGSVGKAKKRRKTVVASSV